MLVPQSLVIYAGKIIIALGFLNVARVVRSFVLNKLFFLPNIHIIMKIEKKFNLNPIALFYARLNIDYQKGSDFWEGVRKNKEIFFRRLCGKTQVEKTFKYRFDIV